MWKLPILPISLALSASLASAHCPLCTGAVGAAAVSAKYLGMDTSIIGLLIGAFAVSTGLLAGLKLRRRLVPGQVWIIVAASFLLTVIPLRFVSTDNLYFPLLLLGEPGTMLNRVYWIDRMLFGALIGGITALAAFWLHTAIKRMRGRVLVPFQGVILTVLCLAVVGGVLTLAIGG